MYFKDIRPQLHIQTLMGIMS